VDEQGAGDEHDQRSEPDPAPDRLAEQDRGD
jgi:hypothetical protein